MIGVITIFRIVIAHNVYSGRIISFVRHEYPCKGTCDRSTVVYGPHYRRQPFGNFADTHGRRRVGIIAPEIRLVYTSVVKNRMRVRIVWIVDFIAYAPKRHTRVIAVAAYHIGYVPFYPFLEKVERTFELRRADIPSGDPFAFWEFPFVGGLVHHQQTKFVTKVIENRSLRIMTHTDSIDTYRFQAFKASAPHLRRNDSTEDSGIMMKAYTFDLGIAAIKSKTLVGAEFQCTESHPALRTVDNIAFTVFQQNSKRI